jgi:uncharacterized damage-inducible protein DinB
MRRIVGATLLVVFPACALHAQSHARAADEAVGTTRALWKTMSGYVTQAAEDMPDAKYSYKPTPDVRSFGELIAHVAGSQYMFCAAATGDSARAEDDIEKKKLTSKADLLAAMRASNEYCVRAYSQTDDASAAKVKLFGQEQTRLYALTINATHDAEHYGNIVTYMRMNGMVPPSSKRQ